MSFVKTIESSTTASGGRLILGGFDEDNMLGQISWIDSASILFWGFAFQSGAVRYGGIDIFEGTGLPLRLSEWPDPILLKSRGALH